MFRRYTTLHIFVTLAAFSVAAVWIGISAGRHSTAQTRCENKFFAAGSGTVSSEGRILCNVFPWVDVGVMGGIWLLLAIAQVRKYIVFARATVLTLGTSRSTSTLLSQGMAQASVRITSATILSTL